LRVLASLTPAAETANRRMSRRVVITGMGAISALGRNVPELWDALAAGRSGIAPLEGIPEPLRFANGAQVRGYDPAAYFDPKEIDLLDRFAQFGTIAAREAVANAGIGDQREWRARTAIVTGCCVGGQETEDRQFEGLYRQNNPRVAPMTIPRIMGNAAASRISVEFGVTGPVYNISTACSSSNHAIGNAFWMVRNGAADMAIAGGSEAIFSLGFLKAWEAMRVVSTDTCRPFSKDRRGMILGEGGAMLILESLDSAQARGARIYAEIAGFGMSSDAHHITQPSSEGPARAMRAALLDASTEPQQIGYINAHGTGTPTNDPVETAAIRGVFGAHADKLAVSSTKSMHGHALGAAGALEAVATVTALDRGVLPPTANFTGPDPACDLDVIPNVARPAQVEWAMSNSFAFGGLNAVLVFRRMK
jgi:nodulation protein E